MQTLSPDHRRVLRARAHSLHPVVMISEAGLSPSVLHEIDVSLTSHELIKIRVFSDDREQREQLMSRICEELGAQPVQHIGKILVVYRQRPPEIKTVPKRRRGASAKPRTKRAFQGND